MPKIICDGNDHVRSSWFWCVVIFNSIKSLWLASMHWFLNHILCHSGSWAGVIYPLRVNYHFCEDNLNFIFQKIQKDYNLSKKYSNKQPCCNFNMDNLFRNRGRNKVGHKMSLQFFKTLHARNYLFYIYSMYHVCCLSEWVRLHTLYIRQFPSTCRRRLLHQTYAKKICGLLIILQTSKGRDLLNYTKVHCTHPIFIKFVCLHCSACFRYFLCFDRQPGPDLFIIFVFP